MGADDDNQPLANDPAREAAASMRGYWTQIWRSVLAWIDLGDAERLYLEGAEDIDRVSGLAAETIQVKDVQGNITLRSGDVIEAIDNAWAHRQRNPTRSIRFRFLTTSRITVEQGAPFGDGVGGLNLWRNARLSDDEAERHRDARAIATFLMAEGKVSAPSGRSCRQDRMQRYGKDLSRPLNGTPRPRKRRRSFGRSRTGSSSWAKPWG